MNCLHFSTYIYIQSTASDMMYSKSQSDEQRTDESHLHGGNNNLDNMMERKSEVEKEQASAAKKSLRGELYEPPVASIIHICHILRH